MAASVAVYVWTAAVKYEELTRLFFFVSHLRLPSAVCVVPTTSFVCSCNLLRRQHQLGYTPTYVIGTLALPTFIFLFYAAIKKGQAEVEEDDAKFDGTW